jgi:hypothetical protein
LRAIPTETGFSKRSFRARANENMVRPLADIMAAAFAEEKCVYELRFARGRAPALRDRLTKELDNARARH